MSKRPIAPLAAALTVLLTAAGTAGVAAAAEVSPPDPQVGLTATALVMGPTGIPTPGQGYLDAVDRIYLDPLGFSGSTQALYTPEDSGNTDEGLAADALYLENAVDERWDGGNGTLSPEDPIWIFGYSQSTAAAALAAEHFQAEGIPQEDLHFVLVGDSASAHGGFLNELLPSMPPWLQQLVEPNLGLFGIADSAGLTTPDYYDTDVYTISTDGYANWPSDIFDLPAVLTAIGGMFSAHLLYLGLDPDDIPTEPTFTDGVADYFTIDADSFNGWDALINAGVAADYLPDWLGDLLT